MGVEWDDGARGKHDGEHKGRRYFTCGTTGEGREKAASFVRPKKIKTGETLLQALCERYGNVAAMEAALTDMAVKLVFRRVIFGFKRR